MNIFALLQDNPIIRKDAALLMRRKRTIAIWVLAAVAVVVVGTMVVLSESRDLRLYGTLNTVGDDLFLVMLGMALVGAGVLLPAMASASISGEREHGTLPLLIVSGMSAERIVAGKLAAILLVGAPFLALTLPGMALGSIFLGVDIPQVLLTIVGLAAASVAFAAVGVFASAVNNRARAAAPGALVMAGIPAILVAIPTFATGVAVTDGEDAKLRLIAGAIAAAMVIASAAVYGAWSALAPRQAFRFGRASLVFVFAAVVAPAFVGLLGVTDTGRVPEVQGAMLFGAFAIIVGAVLVYCAGVGRDVYAPAAWKVVPLAVIAGGIGMASAVFLGVDETHSWQPRDTAHFIVALGQVVGAASIAAFLGRFIKTTGVAALLGALSVGLLMLVPAVLDEVTTGTPPFALFNFAYAKPDNMVVGGVFWLVVSVSALALARRKTAIRD